MINHKKGGRRERAVERWPTDQEKSLPNPGTNPLVPQWNAERKVKSINTPLFSIHSA